MGKARDYYNEKVAQCIEKGYLVEPKDFKGDLQGLPKAYQPYSFALKDAERLPPRKQEERSHYPQPTSVPRIRARYQKSRPGL